MCRSANLAETNGFILLLLIYCGPNHSEDKTEFALRQSVLLRMDITECVEFLGNHAHAP